MTVLSESTNKQKPKRFDTYKRLLSFIKPYWKTFALAILATIFYALAESSLAGLMQPLLDGSFIEKDPFYIRWMPIIIALVFIFRSLMAFSSTIGMESVSTNVIKDIRQQLFDTTIHLPDQVLHKTASGKLQSIFVFNAQEMLNATTNVLTTLIRDSLVIIALVGFVFYQHWQLATILFLIIPFVALITTWVVARLKRLSKNLLDSTGDIGQQVNEALLGHREIKIYSATEMVSDQFRQNNAKVRRSMLGVTRARVIASQTTMLITVIAMSLMIYAAIYYAGRGEISVGKFISIFTAMAMLLPPIKRLTKVNELLQRGITAAEDVFEWIDSPKESLNTPQAKAALNASLTKNSLSEDIKINQLSLQFPNTEQSILNNISLTIPAKKMTAFVGPSGGGKTTLLHCIPRLIEAQSGSICIGDRDIKDIPRETLRSHMSYVGQFPVLFDLSIAENIALSARGTGKQGITFNEEAVKTALEAANAWQFVDQLPQKMHTKTGPNGASLSGGQRQRIALARALYRDSAIILLDEATSALDTESEIKIQQALEKLQSHKTLVLIAHRLSSIRNADQIAVINSGKIIESGSHQELMQLNSSYAHMVKQQTVE
jgi:subfamily B ATP-binding cassette protein MsbA